ncbi:hypothetical protein C8J57DRAFT_1525712 [Mycena rebaudengoi]|nr:hypothetical protein C8J57DRAFT_1525712 [Mycena rebaudengoi]
MANHSAECPKGCLNGEVLKSMYAITTATDGTLQFMPGNEQIPANWGRRPFLLQCTEPLIFSDLIHMWLKYPELLTIGRNISGTNTYAPIDIGNLTGGGCALQILVPDALSWLAGFVDAIVTKLLEMTGPLLAQLTCPELDVLNKSMLEKFPGYRHTSHAV